MSRALARTLDVLPTIADVLNVPVGFSADGVSAFSSEARRRGTVRIPTRRFDRLIQIGKGRWIRRRRAVVRRRLRRYGSGELATLYTGIGPNRRLIGQQLTAVAPRSAGRVRARFVFGGRLRRVRRASGLMPTQVAGTLRGGRRGARRDLAVAVNGRIEAVGRSWRLRGRRGERFALNVPEAVLREGRNTLVLLEVRARGRLVRVLGRI